MRRPVANSTQITAILLLWTLLFHAIIEATTVSSSQDLASLNGPRPPAAALIEKRKHKTRHKSTVHQEQQQHADSSETTRRRSHHHAAKKLHPKSTFIRKGRTYIAGRPDWYNHYRRQRGPRNIMRKLTLESSHRRKASLTFPLMGGPPSDSNESAAAADNDDDDDNGGDELGTESKATEDQSGVKDKPVEEDGGDGKEEAASEDGHEDEEGSRGSQSIQAVKKPQFVGVPMPVSVRHSGIIPKESRCGRLEEHGRLQAWMVALLVGVVLAV